MGQLELYKPLVVQHVSLVQRNSSNGLGLKRNGGTTAGANSLPLIVMDFFWVPRDHFLSSAKRIQHSSFSLQLSLRHLNVSERRGEERNPFPSLFRNKQKGKFGVPAIHYSNNSIQKGRRAVVQQRVTITFSSSESYKCSLSTPSESLLGTCRLAGWRGVSRQKSTS